MLAVSSALNWSVDAVSGGVGVLDSGTSFTEVSSTILKLSEGCAANEAVVARPGAETDPVASPASPSPVPDLLMLMGEQLELGQKTYDPAEAVPLEPPAPRVPEASVAAVFVPPEPSVETTATEARGDSDCP